MQPLYKLKFAYYFAQKLAKTVYQIRGYSMQKNTPENPQAEIKDWHRADVIAALKKAGLTLRGLSVAHGLSPYTLSGALKQSYPKAERIIAEALGLQPENIWAARYAERAKKENNRLTVYGRK